MKKTIILAALIALFTSSCTKDETTTDVASLASAKINGKAFTSTQTTSEPSVAGGVIIRLKDGTTEVVMTTSSAEVGVYTITNLKSAGVEKTAVAQIIQNGTTTYADSGNVEIKSNTGTGISGVGTFSAGALKVTDVKFDNLVVESLVDLIVGTYNGTKAISTFETVTRIDSVGQQTTSQEWVYKNIASKAKISSAGTNVVDILISANSGEFQTYTMSSLSLSKESWDISTKNPKDTLTTITTTYSRINLYATAQVPDSLGIVRTVNSGVGSIDLSSNQLVIYGGSESTTYWTKQ